jgi:hypothetical protein
MNEEDDSNNVNEGESVCEGDTWLLLDLDQWFTDQNAGLEDKSFTLRISWPASVSFNSKFRPIISLMIVCFIVIYRL